jgi:hypothetical protein
VARDGRRNAENEIPSAGEILERADFLELWNEKRFLGQEFLTWLWLRSEENGRIMELSDGRKLELWFENQLRLSRGQGPNKRSVSITTPEEPSDQDWREAYTALIYHKTVNKGTLRIKTESQEWRLTLPHDTLSPQGIKIQTLRDSADDGDLGAEGKFLERVSLAAELLGILDALFGNFINLRMSDEWESDELQRLRDFLDSRK